MAVKNRPLGRIDGQTNYATYEFTVTSGVTITDGDFVYFASGRITNSSVAGARILGMALQTATGTAGTVKCLVCIDPTMRYLVDNDNDTTTFAATHVGTNFDLIGATGAQLVDTSSTGTTGSLICIEYNPQIDPVKTDTSWGVFMIAENVLNTGTGAQ
jgi:hypothetical protein